MTNATLEKHYHKPEQVLYMAMELSAKRWLLGFSTGPGCKARRRSVGAGDRKAVLREIELAKARFGLAPDTQVYSCHEAGRDGFWIHRWLTSEGIVNLVVDSSSVEVNRRRRRAKTDSLDVDALLRLLARWWGGEKKAWKVVNVPSREEEDRRQLQRELKSCKKTRTAVVNRIRGLLALHGLAAGTVDARLGGRLAGLRDWNGDPLPPDLLARLSREVECWKQAQARIVALRKERGRRARDLSLPGTEQARRLWSLKAIGLETAWTVEHELFGWRRFRNGRQVGGATGLAPSPWSSGTTVRERGISKAGNEWVRALAVEVAWMWIRYQTRSELTLWFNRRFANAGKRARKVGAAALARRLMVQLWRFRETGVPPAGAVFKRIPKAAA